MPQTDTNQPSITLDATENPGANVLVNDGAGLVVMTMVDAVDSCMQGHRARGAASEELQHIVEHLQDWCKKRESLIAAVHVTISHGKVLILCAPRGDVYSFELGDHLAELNMQMTAAFRLFSFDAIQAPVDGFQGFAETRVASTEKGAPATT